jgi:hypothetical protein
MALDSPGNELAVATHTALQGDTVVGLAELQSLCVSRYTFSPS